MARVTSAGSDAENASESGSRPPVSKRAAEPEDVEMAEGDDDGDEGEGEGEEYEIEEILDAKRGAFPDGRMGYFVKWKGYDETENSWVDETDAGNAKALIDEFWRKKKVNKNKRPSEVKTPKKGPRKSVASEDTESTAEKKRGRKSASTKDDQTMDDSASRALKKAKKARETEEPEQTADEDFAVGDMSKHMDITNWEHLVKQVDTVEREGDALWVYFTLVSGERVREKSRRCAERFPQKLITFYESNLRWRAAEELAE